MNHSKIVAVDCDGVLLDTLYYWFKWLDHACVEPHPFTVEELRTDYDLGKRFIPYLPHGLCPYDFFKRVDAYCCDGMLPYDGAAKGLQKIREAGFQPVIVSYVIGDHFNSKLEWCKRHFGISEYEFISTKNKGLVNARALIDDRKEHLSQMDWDYSSRILFETQYETEKDAVCLIQKDWSDEEVEKVIAKISEPRYHAAYD